MKKYSHVIIILCALLYFGQLSHAQVAATKQDITVQLSGQKNGAIAYNDLANADILLAGIDAKEYELVSYRIGFELTRGTFVENTVQGDSLDIDTREMFQKVAIGSKIYIDNIIVRDKAGEKKSVDATAITVIR